MSGFLERFVLNSGDEVAKDWVAAAIVFALPDGEEREFSHLREALVPLEPELESRMARTQGTRLEMKGRLDDEPLLALAVVAAETKFGRSAGADGRKHLFRAILEVVAANAPITVRDLTHHVCRALRMELETLEKNPTAREPMPNFTSGWELMAWFRSQTQRYPEYVMDSAARRFLPALRQALLMPVGRSAAWGILDDDDEDLLAMPSIRIEGTLPIHQPPEGWLVPEPTDAIEMKLAERVRQEVVDATLSTVTPLSRFAQTSSSVLSDAEMGGELQTCLQDADRAHAAKDTVTESRALLRALVAATATAPAWASRLRWALSGDEVPHLYPGVLTLDAAWLLRPEWRPRGSQEPRGVVPIPLPRALRERLIRFGSGPRASEPVLFPLAGMSNALAETAAPGRPTLSQLLRTVISRLMRTQPFGVSLAQHVAGDDLGLDDAVLRYDRLAAAEIASTVSRTTFCWFGDKPQDHPFPRPTHFVGSRRVVSTKEVANYLETIRRAYEAASKGQPWEALRHRMRNDVHGFVLLTAHRPNNGLGRQRLKSLSTSEPVGTVCDKQVSCDWLLRPVGLSARWQGALRSLLAHLSDAATQYSGTALGEAAAQALNGTGPIFLDIRSPDDVRPFGLEAYQEGLPPRLREIDNFARHLLNFHLAALVPESLRVGQLGWHGTREGAWADGSPWSVLSAARELQPALDTCLKRFGWRPLPGTQRMPKVENHWPLTWLHHEMEHEGWDPLESTCRHASLSIL